VGEATNAVVYSAYRSRCALVRSWGAVQHPGDVAEATSLRYASSIERITAVRLTCCACSAINRKRRILLRPCPCSASSFNSSVPLPPTTYPLLDALPKERVTSGKLSDLQLEGILYACTKHQVFIVALIKSPHVRPRQRV
jgi:hypothetical protein